MRDENRIKPFLRELEFFWLQYPDLRFGQIIHLLKKTANEDFFNIEDDKLLEYIKKLK